MARSPEVVATVALVVLCVWASVRDVRTGRIPNALTYSGLLLGLGFWALAGGWIAWSQGGEVALGMGRGLRLSGVSMLCGLVPAAAVVLMGGLGGGDMKLLGACGAWLASPMAVLDLAVVALVVAAGMAVVLMVKRRVVRRTLAGVLGVGLLALSRVKPGWVDRAEGLGGGTVPFALAVLVGAGFSAGEHLLGLRWPWSGW